MIKLYLSPEEAALALGRARGIRFSFRWRSAADGVTPWRQLRVFVWGTYLGHNPHRDRRCCSNGITLLSLSWGKEVSL